jgi:hypothetical protein
MIPHFLIIVNSPLRQKDGGRNWQSLALRCPEIEKTAAGSHWIQGQSLSESITTHLSTGTHALRCELYRKKIILNLKTNFWSDAWHYKICLSGQPTMQLMRSSPVEVITN